MEHYSEKDEAQESLLGERTPSRAPLRKKSHPSRSSLVIITALNTLLFGASLVVLVASKYSLWPPISRNAALKATSTYSPILSDVDLPLISSPINSSLFGEITSIWRGLPNNPDTEAAWDQFEHIRTLPLTSSQIQRMGKDPSTVAKFEDAVWNLGDNAYVGALDFFHQVHCLNLLRNAAFFNHPATMVTKHGKQDKLYWVHLQHCTDMLMQHLLCTADTGMITYQWKEDNAHPFPDFTVNRECKNWHQLAAYRDEKAVDLEKYMTYTKPDWVEEVPQPKEYWALLKEVGEAGEEAAHVH
ncbi:hypothetical protein HII31_11598 [Pseudocercospora fuligena]|uniref:Tat pathway signal sequence n=1 Tax=Pseudocercospora fuligena TaxID=685502 RepID=A0A8H6VG86_9PEZI|nr:hypothetical protein HII31_11598 [Pseudocercospora fuligena]